MPQSKIVLNYKPLKYSKLASKKLATTFLGSTISGETCAKEVPRLLAKDSRCSCRTMPGKALDTSYLKITLSLGLLRKILEVVK